MIKTLYCFKYFFVSCFYLNLLRFLMKLNSHLFYLHVSKFTQQNKSDTRDLGIHRFIDTVRNVIIASTDIPGVSKIPVVDDDMSTKQQNLHYSRGMNKDFIWGSQFVYADKLVTNETIVLDMIIINESVV